VHGGNVQRVERMQVDDRFEFLAAIGLVCNQLPGRPAQRVGIQQYKAAAGQAHQRRLRADIDDPTDLE
jgi:hypothetical protein